MTQPKQANQNTWNSPRWKGITRSYTPADVDRLRGTVHIEYTLARLGSEKLWKLLRTEPYLAALGATTGNQAIDMAQAGLKAIYLGACQAANNNLGSPVYGTSSAPSVVRSVNNALLQADQASHVEGRPEFDWMLPIVADAEAASGSHLDTFELMKAMIEAGAAAVHFDDQVASARKCGHVSGKELVPTEEATQKLAAARLAADILGVPTVIIARTDAGSATLVTSDYDERDRRFLTGERSLDGYHVYRGGLQAAIARALAYALYADLLLYETTEPNLHEARQFANAIHAQFPGKMLAYNCSPSFQWRAKLNEVDIACFQRDLAAMGYRFQFLNLAGIETHNLSMYEFARDYACNGMTAYSQMQERQIETAEIPRYSAPKQPRVAGTGYFNTGAKSFGNRRVSSSVNTEPFEMETVANSVGNGQAPISDDIEHFEMHTEDYNDGEATERTPMPHLYLLLESMPLPSTAAND